MMKKVIFKGEFVPPRDVPRGDPILRTPEEWHQRGVGIRKKVRTDSIITVSLFAFTVWIVLSLVFNGAIRGEAVLLAAIFAIVYSIGTYVMEVYYSWREVGRTIYSGLFEGGLQVRTFGYDMVFFIPYSDIQNFRVTDGWFTQRLELFEGDAKKPLKLEGIPPLLGEDGLAELRRRISPEYGPSEPPKLIIYGDRPMPSHTQLGLGRDIPWAAPRL
jgi:hypothetical protein